jgi:DNA primase large subunit
MKAVRTSLPAGLADTSYHSRSSGIPPADLEGAFTFYEHPPAGDIRISHLDHLTRLRLRLLQLIDRKFQRNPSSLDEFEHQEGGNILAAIPAIFRESPEDEIMSHYMTRMGLAKTQEFVEWFVKQEELLFYLKLKSAGLEGLKEVLSRTGISADVKAVMNSSDDAGLSAFLGPNLTVYVMPFTKVAPSLVARRLCIIKKGLAYIPESEIYGIVTARFKAYLQQCMRLAEREYKSFLADERLGRILKTISPLAASTGNSKMANLDASTLNLGNFNIAMARSFPPCMRLPIEWMREKKIHLKNTARNQLYPFVRAAGMTMEDSISLWKKEFTNDKSVALDKFDKDYLYTIKWTYGKAGRMKAANPFSCSATIGLEHPSGDQAHGCVFKVLDSASLAGLLRKWAGVAGIEGGLGWIQDIVNKASVTHEYQLACVEFFRNMHPGAAGDGVGNSPAAYFAESVEYWKKRDSDGAAVASRNA